MQKNTQQKMMMSVIALLILSGLFISALQHFVLTLPKQPQHTTKADGIVVTTGGQGRLRTGLDLLQADKAPHLLLSGVGQGITKQMIAQSMTLSSQDKQALRCCVTLEFQAGDTLGNAIATRQWAQTHQVSRFFLVTSAYHMPRATLEFSALMPDKTIIAFPVVAPDLIGKSWYSDWATFKLYLREFLKYSWRRGALIFR